jgi:methylmalonyl-CoA mutase
MSRTPIRVLTAVALCDGHDAAIVAVSRALRHRGMEVVYIGFHKSPRQIAEAAIQEDVDIVGISSYNGGHVEFVEDVVAHMDRLGRRLPIVCGGGGTMTPDDVAALAPLGVARVFLPGETLESIAIEVERIALGSKRTRGPVAAVAPRAYRGDMAALAELLTLVENDGALAAEAASLAPADAPGAFVAGICGPGGAGKSTMIDELCLRWIADPARGPVCVLCSDPSSTMAGEGCGGALLGDRIRMVATERERVFVRSLATRAQGAVSPSVPALLRTLRRGPFPLVILESAGIGQGDHPFGSEVDLNIVVMTDEFGSPIQLEKMMALEQADAVVLNKADRPAAPAAASMIRARLRSIRRPGKPAVELFTASASRHRDAGVDALFAWILEARGAAVRA